MLVLFAVLSVFVGLAYMVFSFVDPPHSLHAWLRPSIISTTWFSDTTIAFFIGVFFVIVPPMLLIGLPAFLR